MDLDAFCPCHESENIVSVDRIAASCHLVVDSAYVLGIDHKDVISAGLLTSLYSARLLLVRFLELHFAVLDLGDHILDIGDVKLTLADRRIECIDGLVGEFLHYRRHCLVIQLHLPVLQASCKELLSVRGLLELSLAELLAYLVAGLGADHYAEPVL